MRSIVLPKTGKGILNMRNSKTGVGGRRESSKNVFTMTGRAAKATEEALHHVVAGPGYGNFVLL